MHDITAIRPNGSLESSLTECGLSTDPEAVRVLGFPKALSEFDIEIERKLIANRELSISVTVDLLTGKCRRNDMYPETTPRTLSSTSLLNPQFDQETITELARSSVRRHLNRRYNSFRPPEIRPVRTETVFKLFWVVPTSSTTVHVIDTITNQLTATDIELDELTSEPAHEAF